MRFSARSIVPSPPSTTDEVGRSEIAVRRTVVLLGLVLRIDELDAALARDALEAFERLADHLRVAVGDDRSSANGLS